MVMLIIIIVVLFILLLLFYYATFIINMVNGWEYETKKDITHGFIPFYHWYNDALNNYRDLD